MAQPSDPYMLLESWRALSARDKSEGWQTIPLDITGNVTLLAGRHYPDDTEALLIGFQSVSLPASRHLPQGQGFRVEKVKSQVLGGNQVWIALSRLPDGTLDMFTIMAQDIVQTVSEHALQNESSIFQVFLGRIRAWQSFMDKASVSSLSAEAETGLFGELCMLEEMLTQGVFPRLAVEAWVGPVDGLQDFRLGDGAIEVKSTVAVKTFPAKISSLDQLDESQIRPLYLAGIRLELTDSGMTLPEYAAAVRVYFEDEPAAVNTFDCRLLQAGLLMAFSDRYSRRFKPVSTNVYLITDTFPRLTRATVPLEISKASYELDLALVNTGPLTMKEAIETLRGN